MALRNLKYPAQPCGLPYDKFRAGWTFRDAYEALAYQKGAQGQTFKPSQRRIVGQLARMKKADFAQYERDCSDESTETEAERIARFERYQRDADNDDPAAMFGLGCACGTTRKKSKRRRR